MAPQAGLLPVATILLEEATSSASSSTSSLLSTAFLYALVVLGIIAVFICLASFLYELSDQHHRTRLAFLYGTDDDDDDAVRLGTYGTFRDDRDGGRNGAGDRIRFEGCGIIQEGE
ncbi:MAG: hypothetical protein Q9196_005338 [Gyalolechia fulgens]